MNEPRNRSRKVTRKAGPPEENAGELAAESAPIFQAPEQSEKSEQPQKSGEPDQAEPAENNTGQGDESSNQEQGNKPDNNQQTDRRNNDGGNNRSRNNNRNRGGRGRGRGGSGNNRNREGNRRNPVKSMQGHDLTKRLPEPPKPPKGGLRIYALGGITEIGRNMTVFEYNGRLLIVDVGVLFPTSNEPGVDLVLPDFGPIEKKLDKIDGIVVTHGHEDHIGAIPWLLKLRHDIPIYSAKFSLALIAAKTKEHRQRPKMTEVTKDSDINVGAFRLRFWTVGHSIPDALGVSIKVGGNHVVMTGDVKMDQTPYDKKPTDLPALSRLGDEGIDLFLCDSTNASTPGVSRSEIGIEAEFKRLVNRASQRVILSSFASNVSRVQMAVNAAVAANRKVSFNGRSMIRNMEIAEKMGYLKAPRGTIVDLNEAAKMAPHKVMLITTGTQGEPMAALSRMARREHRQITVREGDMVILSSSKIPGNEEAIYAVINNLSQIGAEIVTGDDANVHTSGHGYSGELVFLYNAARPKNAMPVHGEWRHLRANGELAVATGTPRNNVVLAQNGVVVDLVDGKAKVAGQYEVGHLYVDGASMGKVEQDVLADRTSMGSGGVVSITCVIDDATGRLIEAPRVSTTGFAEDDRGVTPEVIEEAETAMNDLAASGENDPYRMVQQLRRKLSRLIEKKWKREPVILPTIVPISSTTGAVEDADVQAARESQ